MGSGADRRQPNFPAAPGADVAQTSGRLPPTHRRAAADGGDHPPPAVARYWHRDCHWSSSERRGTNHRPEPRRARDPGSRPQSGRRLPRRLGEDLVDVIATNQRCTDTAGSPSWRSRCNLLGLIRRVSTDVTDTAVAMVTAREHAGLHCHHRFSRLVGIWQRPWSWPWRRSNDQGRKTGFWHVAPRTEHDSLLGLKLRLGDPTQAQPIANIATVQTDLLLSPSNEVAPLPARRPADIAGGIGEDNLAAARQAIAWSFVRQSPGAVPCPASR